MVPVVMPPQPALRRRAAAHWDGFFWRRSGTHQFLGRPSLCLCCVTCRVFWVVCIWGVLFTGMDFGHVPAFFKLWITTG